MSAVLLAAVADTLAEHTTHEIRVSDPARPGCLVVQSRCNASACGWRGVSTQVAAHQAERVVARLTELLPGLPAEDVAALIGGTVERKESRINATWHYRRAYGPWVPDSPPAAEGGE